MSAPGEAKRSTRDAVRAQLAMVSGDDRRRWSGEIANALESSEPWTSARSVLVFLGDEGEPNLDGVITRAIERGVRIAAPRMDWDAKSMHAVELGSLEATEVRRHGIREPVVGPSIEPAELDLILVPGVAFDASGGRLGRGAGFYDRFLERAGEGPLLVGVCFETQVIGSVPQETHDRGVDALVSERGFRLLGRG